MMGLTVLARLDAVFFVAALALVILPVLRRVGWDRVALAVLGGACLTVPYALYNLVQFGGIMPVSGLVKSRTTPSLSEGLDSLRQNLERIGNLVPPDVEPLVPAIFVAFLLLGGALLLRVLTWLPRDPSSRLLALVPIAAVAHSMWYLLFIREQLTPWHGYLQFLSILIVFASVPGLVFRGRREGIVSVILVALMIGTTGGFAWMKSKREGDRECSYIAAQWLQDTPLGTRAAMMDGWLVQLYAGPEYHILDLTGLISDRENALLAKNRDYGELLDRNEIEYVLGFEEFVQTLGTGPVQRRAKVPWNHDVRSFLLAEYNPTASREGGDPAAQSPR